MTAAVVPEDAPAARSPDSQAAFVRHVHGLVRDLLVPNPAIYWADFLVSATVCYLAIYFYVTAPALSFQQLGCGLVAALAFYRAATFTHELSHLPKARFWSFRIGWNLLFGIPMLMPSFLYSDHRSHHTNQRYGTGQDAEYYPLAYGPMMVILLYFAHLIIIPILGVIRFLILAPISYLHPALRRLVWARASSLANINPAYTRPEPTDDERFEWRWQEAGCFAVLIIVLTLLLTGKLSSWFPLQMYGVLIVSVGINYVRALGSHRYLSHGEPQGYVDQMLDSTTIPGQPIVTELWAPLGMRYHALHHLIPSLPYHALGAAHRRLVAELPPGNPYAETIRPGLMAALWEVCRSAAHGGPQLAQGDR